MDFSHNWLFNLCLHHVLDVVVSRELLLEFLCLCGAKAIGITYKLPRNLYYQIKSQRDQSHSQKVGLLACFCGNAVVLRELPFYFSSLVVPNQLVSLTSQLEACSARIRAQKKTERQINPRCT